MFGGAGGGFGAAQSSGGGLFGAAATGGGLFGAAPSSGGGLFGAATSGGGMFGGAGGGFGAASSGGGLFGAAATGGGMFGAGATGGGMLGGATGGGMFGAGAPSSGGLFGAAATGGGMFGAAAPGVGGQMGQVGAPLTPDAQFQCLDIKRQMEELYPVLQRANGDRYGQSAMHSALQQSFVAFTYSPTENAQQQASNFQFDQMLHVDYAKWVQAVQNNPDPRVCHPEALVGLPALEARLQTQQARTEQSLAALEELKRGFGQLKDSHQAQILQKLEECRQRHQKLSRQLLQVVSSVETYAILNGAARRSPHVEMQLEERFLKLEDAVHAPASARARLEELWVVLRGLQQRGPPPEGAARIADGEAGRTLHLTGQQGELLEALQEELAVRKADVAQFETAVNRFSAAPVAP